MTLLEYFYENSYRIIHYIRKKTILILQLEI
jgi:hypothetical protein